MIISNPQYDWRESNCKTFGMEGIDEYLYENYLKNIEKGFI